MKRFVAIIALVAPAIALGESWQSPDALRRAAEHLVRAQMAVPGQALQVAAALDDRLRLPACAGPPDARIHQLSGSAATVALSCAAPSAWTLYVVVQVSRQAQVLVLNRALGAGEAVTPEALSLVPRDVAPLAYGYFTRADEAIGRVARRALSAGAVLGPNDLAPPRLVRRGDIVTLVGRSGSLLVRAEGKAMADGVAGESIAVQNLSTRRVVRGRVRSGQEVDIDL